MKVSERRFNYWSFILLWGLLFALSSACNKSPKVIEANESSASETSSGVFDEEPATHTHSPSPSSADFSDQVHKVVVQEILPTTKYVYLKVSEGVKQYWIATRKQDIQLGGRYFYRDGLLKTNFESKEYNRVFDRIFLVSKLVAENHGGGGSLPSTPKNYVEKRSETTSSTSNTQTPGKEGSITIAELVSNPQRYAGKQVQISGTCSKINPNIMNRNWIHLQDGTKDDFDLVVTTTAHVHEGEAVTLKAVVTLDKDFGAGYRYDLILENGLVVN
ncbi:MAG: hypothetical protein AAF587_05710 [Bacteroidota bacterium]